jgi:hypothetical protein
LKTAGVQWLAATDATGDITGVQGGITVQAASPSELMVVGFPSPIIAGVAGAFAVTAQDAFGNTVRNYAGSISFASSDPQAVLPANYAFSASDNGVHSFSAILKTAGAQWIKAVDTVMAGLAGTQTAQVNPGAASRLRISGPSSVIAGTPFTVTVSVFDAYGNIATDYNGTVSVKSSDAAATLPAKYTFTAADQGVHTFSGLKFKKKGTQTITITDSLKPALTATLTVNVN